MAAPKKVVPAAVIASTSPTEQPPAAPPAPDPDKLPEGSFYVLQRVSKMGDSGVLTFRPGDLVSKVDGGYSNGKYILDVPPAMLTDSRSAGEALLAARNVPAPRPTTVEAAPPQASPTQNAAIDRQIARQAAINHNAAIDREIARLEGEIGKLLEKYAPKDRNGDGVMDKRIDASAPAVARIRQQIAKLAASKVR